MSLAEEDVAHQTLDSVAPAPPDPALKPQTKPGLSRRSLLRTSGVAATAAALAATITTPVAAQDTPPDPNVPSMRSPYRATTAALANAPDLPQLRVIAYNRLAFGHRNGSYSEWVALGDSEPARFATFIDQQLNPQTIDDADFDARLAAQGYVTLGKSRAKLWQDHQRADGIEWWERLLPVEETMQAAFLRAVYSKKQLFEVIVDFWHNHFNVYGWDTPAASTWVAYDRDVIRANAFGNFRKMLGGVSQSIAMLYFLDNISNTAGGPNENYSRETFELHSLGAENYLGVISTVGTNGAYQHPAALLENGVASMYVDDDVYSATLAYTGWRLDEDTGAFRFDDQDHFQGKINVLGKLVDCRKGIDAGNEIFDMIANHPGTARFIARKLCRRLISDHPTEDVVQAAADTFYNNRDAADQIKRTIRTIVEHEAFANTWGEKIKRPFEFIVSAIRATSANYAWSDSLRWRYDSMGQFLFDWRPPNGYPDFKEAWSSTMPMLQRWRTINWMMDNWRIEGDGANKDDLRINVLGQTPADRKSANALVDYWSGRCLLRPLPPEERGPILAFMAAGKNPDSELPAEDISERLRFMVGLILMSPSFQWR